MSTDAGLGFFSAGAVLNILWLPIANLGELTFFPATDCRQAATSQMKCITMFLSGYIPSK